MKSIERVSCAAILAGGKSSRMGREKALLEIEGEPLIRRTARVLRRVFAQIVVVTNTSEIAEAAALPAIGDLHADKGPLGGIHAALSHYGEPTFVVACDLPFLTVDFLRFLTENFEGEALVPRSPQGLEPLHAIYAPGCLPVFERFLQETKVPSLRRVLEQVDARVLESEVASRFGARFDNWNTPDDVAAASTRLPDT